MIENTGNHIADKPPYPDEWDELGELDWDREVDKHA